LTIATNTNGYQRLSDWVTGHCPDGQVVWAIERCGSYAAGLARHLQAAGEWVIEVERPARPSRQQPSKTDLRDAIRAAREVLGRDINQLATPRQGPTRDRFAVLLVARCGAVDAAADARCQLHAAVLNAPDVLRQRFTGLPAKAKSGWQPVYGPTVTPIPKQVTTPAPCNPSQHAAYTTTNMQTPSNSRSLSSSPTGDPTCSNCQASARSRPRTSYAPGPTPKDSGPKPHSRCALAQHQSPPAQDSATVAASTPTVTANSTATSTPSPSPPTMRPRNHRLPEPETSRRQIRPRNPSLHQALHHPPTLPTTPTPPTLK